MNRAEWQDLSDSVASIGTGIGILNRLALDLVDNTSGETNRHAEDIVWLSERLQSEAALAGQKVDEAEPKLEARS